MKCVVLLVVAATLVACACAAEYEWGKFGPKDYLIAKDKVMKLGVWGFSLTKNYVFKQSKVDALTITSVKVIDQSQKKKCDATVEMINGGPGSKGCKLKFTSYKGKTFHCTVLIQGK